LADSPPSIRADGKAQLALAVTYTLKQATGNDLSAAARSAACLTHPLGATALIPLIVTIGLLNIGLGFGLAMYYDFGPPGLDGIFGALGPMPPAAPSADSPVPIALGAPYDPSVAPETTGEPSTISPLSETLAEEKVLGDVRDLAASAQTAMVSGQVESRE